jgi:chemotaxis protein histidine kinase CheA
MSASQSLHQSSLRYLPVDAAGQRYGISLDEIEAVFRIDTGDLGQSAAGAGEDSDAGSIPIIDLAYLLGGVSHSSKRLHSIVVRGAAGACALLVDLVYPIRTARLNDQLEVPVLMGQARHLYRCMVREEESLVLILNPARLVIEVEDERR